MATASAELTIQPVISRRGRAVAYAEELGLNATWEAAKAAEEALGVLYHQRAQAEAEVRAAKVHVERRTAEVTAGVVEREQGISQAALDRAIKLALASDEKLIDANETLRLGQAAAGEVDAEVKANEASLRQNTARMNELGGYFAYLAASKEALTAERILGQIP